LIFKPFEPRYQEQYYYYYEIINSMYSNYKITYLISLNIILEQ